jgi:tRNA modification GTPase
VLSALEQRVISDLSGADFPAATRVRHAELLREAADHVARALTRLDEPELAAEDVRLAARTMERVVGAVGVEDVLDRVFSTFCIGK